MKLKLPNAAQYCLAMDKAVCQSVYSSLPVDGKRCIAMGSNTSFIAKRRLLTVENDRASQLCPLLHNEQCRAALGSIEKH